MKRKTTDTTGKKEPDFGVGLGGIFGGFATILERLCELADKAKEISKSGEISGEKIKGVYGFTIKTGLGSKTLKVEPFGNIRKDESTGRAVVQEIREPMADIFEESDHLLVVAEMPGIDKEDVAIELEGDILSVRAERGDKKYRKEVLLPRSFEKEKMTVSCNNGIVQIKLLK